MKLKKAWEVTGVRREQAASAVSEAQPICFQHIYKCIYQEKIYILGREEASIKGAEPRFELFQLPSVDSLSFLAFNDLCGYKTQSHNI